MRYTACMRQYITTAIDFPNGDPHMGHVMEKVLADVCARWFRLRGDAVRFQIGTDDHGIKMQRTAEKQGMHPKDLVAQNAPKFQDLFDLLCISYDCFMSTSITEGHYDTVQALWRRLRENGHLEKRTYKGLYCSGCESFVTSKDLVDGLCPNHQKAPDEVEEENWFFLLQDKEEFLADLFKRADGYHLVPEFRAKEVYAFLESGLEDVSFSRPKSTLYWGVPVPEDEDPVMYVWCDNLTNYISTLGYLTDKEDRTYWDDAEVTHVIGKDISRFHALNWPAMLHAAGVKTPDRLLIHGFIKMDGKKMGKSLGNVVVPAEILEHFGGNPDPLRFYLSTIPVGNDGSFSMDRFEEMYNAKLRNDLGNLLNRVMTLLAKEGGTISVGSDPDLVNDTWATYASAMDTFAYSEALDACMEIASRCNQYIDQSKPWEKEGSEKAAILSAVAESLRHVALMLLPFIPDTAREIAVQLGVPYAESMMDKDFHISEQLTAFGGVKDWQSIGESSILFPPLS